MVSESVICILSKRKITLTFVLVFRVNKERNMQKLTLNNNVEMPILGFGAASYMKTSIFNPL